MNVSDHALPFDYSGLLTQVDLERLITAVSPALGGVVGGTARLRLGVKGRAGDASPEGSVRGDATITVRDGRLSGAGFVEQISDRLMGVGQKTAGEAETPFDLLAADFRIGERKMKTENLEFRSPDLDLDGRGSVAFDGMLDFDLTALISVERTESLVRKEPRLEMRVDRRGRLTIPLKVEGGLASPELALDLERIFEEGIKQELKKRLRGLFRRGDR
jgi:hypothetical protein